MAREPTRRSSCKNNLKQIGLALHNYHDIYGSFPPAYTTDTEGNRLHSWRVLLLPYLEEEPLYDQLRLNEPWDSPHNSQFHDRIPRVYRCPSFQIDHHSHLGQRGTEFLTQYVLLTGPDCVFYQERAPRLRDMTDGTSNTALVMDTGPNSVHWMKPVDRSRSEFLADMKCSGREHCSNHRDGIHVLFGDGSVLFLRSSTERSVLDAILTRDGDEVVKLP